VSSKAATRLPKPPCSGQTLHWPQGRNHLNPYSLCIPQVCQDAFHLAAESYGMYAPNTAVSSSRIGDNSKCELMHMSQFGVCRSREWGTRVQFLRSSCFCSGRFSPTSRSPSNAGPKCQLVGGGFAACLKVDLSERTSTHLLKCSCIAYRSLSMPRRLSVSR
jgi:hypothetical protein